jgi:hypothetical protein
MLEMYEKKRRPSMEEVQEIEFDLPKEEPKITRRFGPSTPGSAQVHSGRGIVFRYNHDIIDLHVRPINNVGGVHRMNEPKPMKLIVDMDHGKHDASKHQMDYDLHPEKHQIHTEKIKPIKGIPKNTKNKEEIKNLSLRLTNFNKSQKNTMGMALSITPAKKLDFSHVGITTGIKKIKGFKI